MGSIQKLKTIPNARQISNTLSDPASFEWTHIAPEGCQLDELILSLVLTTTGVATSGTPAALINTLKGFAEGQVAEIDGASIGVCAIGSHVFESEEEYSSSPGNPLIVRDPVLGAAGVYYANYRIKAPLPGTAIKFVLNTVAPNSVIAGITAITVSASLTAVWTKEKKEQYTIFARQASAISKRVYNGVSKGLFVSGSNFSTVGDGIELESALTPEQVLEKQAQGADESRGLSANGTGVARTSGPLLITDPRGASTLGLGTTVGIYQLFMRTPELRQANLGFNTSVTIIAVIFSKIETSKILEA